MIKKDHPHIREYATANGFYIGDKVMLPTGRIAYIDEIVLRNVNYYNHEMSLDQNLTVVRLDDEFWTDANLTRVI